MKNAGKACNNRLYRHIRTFEKIVKNYFVIYINTIKIVAMENKARYNVLDDKIVIIVTLPDKLRDRPLRCLRFCGRYSATADL